MAQVLIADDPSVEQQHQTYHSSVGAQQDYSVASALTASSNDKGDPSSGLGLNNDYYLNKYGLMGLLPSDDNLLNYLYASNPDVRKILEPLLKLPNSDRLAGGYSSEYGLNNDRYLKNYSLKNLLPEDELYIPYYDPYSYGLDSLYSTIDPNKSQVIILLTSVTEELNTVLDNILSRAEDSNVAIDQEYQLRQEIPVQQLVERIHRYREILELEGVTSPWSKYLTLNDYLARVADTNPELYSKLSENLQKLGAEIVQNEQLRNELLGRLDGEEKTLLLSLLYSTAKTGKEIEKTNQVAEDSGLQPTDIFEDFPLVVAMSQSTSTQTGQEQPVGKEEIQQAELMVGELASIANVSNLEELKAILEDMYVNNPYVAHVIDAIAAKYVATGKLDLPEDGVPIGMYLIKNLDKLDEQDRKEFIDTLTRYGISQFYDPRERIEQAMEERENIAKKLSEDQTPEVKQLMASILERTEKMRS